MNAIAQWAGQTLFVGGTVLLFGWLVARVVRQSGARLAISVAALHIAVLAPILALSPRWWRLPTIERVVSADVGQYSRPPAEYKMNEPALSGETNAPFGLLVVLPQEGLRTPISESPDSASQAIGHESPTKTSLNLDSVWSVAAIAYAIGVTIMALRWAAGNIALWRIRLRSRPIDGFPSAILDALSRYTGRRPLVRQSSGLCVPICFGVCRPTIVLPEALVARGNSAQLRLIMAHELAHLHNGDAWTNLIAGLVGVIYWPLPWQWALQRTVRLLQEFLADSKASLHAERVEDYASFLVDLSRSLTRGAQRIAAATAVLGSSSELFRRIQMLLTHRRSSSGLTRRLSIAASCCLIAVAVLLAGFGWHRSAAASPQDAPRAAPVDDKKDEPKKDEPKKGGDENPPQPFPVRPRIMVGDNVPEEYRKFVQKLMEEMMKNMPQGPNFPNLPQFGGALMVPGMPGQGGKSSARLGVAVEKLSPVLIEQLDLPKNQGLVIGEITADSAASKAGLKPNDILLEIGGKPVAADVVEFRKQLAEIKTGDAIDALILRKGKRETIKGIKLPEPKAELEAPRFPNFGGGVFDGPFEAIPIPVPQLPGGIMPPQLPGGVAEQMSVQITNGQFTIHSQKNGVHIDINGTVTEDETKLRSVSVKDGDELFSTASIDKLPEKYRDTVKELLKSVRGEKKK